MTDEVTIEETKIHETMISMDQSALAEHDVGSDIALKVKISCPSQCNLQGGQIRICDDTGAIMKESMLTSFDGTANETDEFVVKAPTEPGKYTWSAAFAAQVKDGITHGESSAPFSFVARPHTAGMAVWDVPSPVTHNADFKVKVGVSCSSACTLAGRPVEIYDHQGTKIAECILGDLPWSETRALYWVEVPLKAPGTGEQYCQWTVKFPKPDLELAHEGTAHSFAFGMAAPPEHGVTVEVRDSNGTPIEKADVTLHASGTPYGNQTDHAGIARLNVPGGDYQLYVYKRFYEDFQSAAEVSGDLTVKVELLPAPDGGI